jgi:ABC-type oligopeptide transport system substrate-binding subunit
MASLSDDPEILMAEYERAQLDLVDLTWLSPAERQRTLQRYASDYITGASLVTHYVAFNIRQPPFDDSRVRRALVLATDRSGFAAISEMGYASAATGGFTPVGAPGHFPGLALPYDVKGARRLMAEAGYPGGAGFPSVKALLFNKASRFAESLIAPWQTRLGVDVSCEIVNWSTFNERLRNERERHHIHTLAWSADYPDPDSFLRLGVKRSNKWENETYSALVNQARRVMNHEERMRLYRQAEEILVQEAPIFPIFYPRRDLLVKPWVRNFRPERIGAPLLKDVIIEPH